MFRGPVLLPRIITVAKDQYKLVVSCSKLSRSSSLLLCQARGLHSERTEKDVAVIKNPLKLSYAHGCCSEPLIGATIGQVLEQAVNKNPDQEAFVFFHQGKRLTLEQLLLKSDELAAGLLALGVERGDRLGIWSPNCMEWILAQFATARAGIILVNINPAYQSSELEFTMRKVGIKALIMAEQFKTQEYYGLLQEVCPELAQTKEGDVIQSKSFSNLKRVIMLSDNHFAGTLRFKDVMEMGKRDDLNYIHDLQHRLQFDDPINIQFTSGTTGFPKGAILSHFNIFNNARFSGFRLNYHTEKTTICVPVPLYHCFGMVMGSLMSVAHGCKVVFPSAGFDSRSALMAVHTERCTSLYGTPTMFIDMLGLPDFDKYDVKSLRRGIMAGSICPVRVMKDVIECLHIDQLAICYGTTENSPVTFQTFGNDSLEKKVETIGKVQSHTEAKIINDAGNVVPIGETGEICIRGYCVMRGYWDDPEQTKKAIGDDGWYKTGDLALMDEEGYVRIIGRKKDMIIRGGENIYPAEIEQFLYKHPKVADVQVIGVPDERLGEKIAAWIQLKENAKATEQEIKDFCKGKIAHYKIPYYVTFVSEFPLTVTGKVQKFKMREKALDIYGLRHEQQHNV